MPTVLIAPADLATRPFLAARQTRNRVGDVDRARLASWYVGAVAGGDRNPARTLADRYPESSYKTWANVFSQARTRDPALLTNPPRRGVAGGVLTDHAERLLKAPSGVPVGLEDDYEKGRDEQRSFRFKGRRTEMPRRSQFASDDDYSLTFDLWDRRGEWFRQIEVEVEVEDWEDWWNRVAEGDR